MILGILIALIQLYGVSPLFIVTFYISGNLYPLDSTALILFNCHVVGIMQFFFETSIMQVG